MPITHNLQLRIDNQLADLGEIGNTGIRISYSLEDPENFEEKQAAMSLDIELPATQTNDQIFNSYYNAKVLDLTAGQIFSNYRSCSVRVNGIELLRGRAVLENSIYQRIQATYDLSLYGQTGDWLLDAKDLTLWDCLSTTPHTFDLATVEASWDNFDSDEFHDYVYAPVRYRQPFDGTAFVDSTGKNLGYGPDDTVNIYHLRPSISIYWILFRFFRSLGYDLNTQFLNINQYFRRLVLTWTWGDFYDLNSQLIQVLEIEAAGAQTTEDPPLTGSSTINLWTGTTSGSTVGSAGGSSWWGTGVTGGLTSGGAILPTGGQYIFTGNLAGTNFFRINNILPPIGNDNIGMYNFDDSTGTMEYFFEGFPPELAAYIGTNVTLSFKLNLMLLLTCFSSTQCMVALEVKHYNSASVLLSTTTNSILPSGGTVVGATHYPDSSGFPTTPTIYNFNVPNVNVGDVIKMRLRVLQNGANPIVCFVAQAGYLKTNPSALGVSQWQYNPITGQFQNVNGGVTNNIWQPMYSTLQMTGMQVQLGNSVNFQFYDKFRSYKALDLLAGVIDMFNLSVQTDPISRVVTIEPTHDYVLPDGTQKKGYFNAGILDWSSKLDISKSNMNTRFKDVERQFDFQFKQDGSDGGLNIYAARYKGIYLNNVRGTQSNGINDTNNENGMIAAIPGSSRYMFPSIFPSGNKQYVNRFFSATMHYKHQPWFSIPELNGFASSDNIASQLITIIPENISDSSASAVTATFEPKIAYYAGKQPINAVGGWRFVGDPNGGGFNVPSYNDSTGAIGFELPYMFAVDYTGWVGTAPGSMAPILTYCDQNINGVVKYGLMKTFFLKRLAIMRTGKQRKLWMRLNLGDITDWLHQNPILINGDIYYLIGIDNFNPTTDDSVQCTFWKVANPQQEDLDNMYPSSTSVLTTPIILPQFDLKYAPLLLYMTDIPTE